MAIKQDIQVNHHPWKQWKPIIGCFLLLMISAFISKGGCSCNVLKNNGSSTLSFSSSSIIKKHVISRGFQTINCHAVNFCRIQWYRQTDSKAMEEYPWDIGQFSEVNLEDNNQSLRFKSADKGAQGNYTCMVSNATHSINRTTILKVDDPFWTGDPLQLQEDLCQNQTAETGQNVSFSCKFYVGAHVGTSSIYWQRPNMTIPEGNWSSCGYGTDWLSIIELKKISKYTAYHQNSSFLNALHVPNFGNQTPSVGSRLDVINISKEEAFGLYCIIANNDGLWSRVVLRLSPPEAQPPTVYYRKQGGMVVVCLVILAALSTLLWKLVALDVKLWHQSHFGHPEENDGRAYDAYISYSWTNQDRQFVLEVIMPYLERFGYRVFVPEIHTIPSNVLLEELSRAMESSRRCIVVITPKYANSEHSKYEVEIAAEVMSSNMLERIIPVLLGVSACVDSSPLYGSEPSLSSSASSSSQPPSLSSDSQSDNSCETSLSRSHSGSSTSSTPSVFLSSKLAKINFNFSPLLGQFIKILKPLKVKKKVPFKIENYNRFLKRLRLRMPKPPGGDLKAVKEEVIETVLHTDNLVDNEQLPDWNGEDVFNLQELPRLYPMVPDGALYIADIPQAV